MRKSEDPDRRAAPEPEWARFTGALLILVMLNALLAFALELALFFFVMWWAASLDMSLWWRLAIGAAAVLALALLWGRYAAPRAPVKLPTAGVLTVKAVAFGAGAAALWAVGSPVAAIAFAALVVANTALVTLVRAGTTSS